MVEEKPKVDKKEKEKPKPAAAAPALNFAAFAAGSAAPADKKRLSAKEKKAQEDKK